MKILRISFLSAVLLSACNSTPPAKNFSGNWQPVNVFQESTREIPLVKQHYFEPLPIDGTLKNMLERWARESKTGLSYMFTSDYTLHVPVATIKQPNLEAALQELNDVYAPQKINIGMESGQIVVRAKLEELSMNKTARAEVVAESEKIAPAKLAQPVLDATNPALDPLDEAIKMANAIAK